MEDDDPLVREGTVAVRMVLRVGEEVRRAQRRMGIADADQLLVDGPKAAADGIAAVCAPA